MSRYFKEIEDGNMDANFLHKLDKARELAGMPFIINSAYRSPEHNAKIGGRPNSSHLKGLAVDIACNKSTDRFDLINCLLDVGFSRIGIASSFIHADIDTDKSIGVIWTY